MCTVQSAFAKVCTLWLLANCLLVFLFVLKNPIPRVTMDGKRPKNQRFDCVKNDFRRAEQQVEDTEEKMGRGVQV